MRNLLRTVVIGLVAFASAATSPLPDEPSEPLNVTLAAGEIILLRAETQWSNALHYELAFTGEPPPLLVLESGERPTAAAVASASTLDPDPPPDTLVENVGQVQEGQAGYEGATTLRYSTSNLWTRESRLISRNAVTPPRWQSYLTVQNKGSAPVTLEFVVVASNDNDAADTPDLDIVTPE